jgi:AraC family transcriptional regulator
MEVNRTVYRDNENNEIRFSRMKKIESEVPFAGLGVKYVAFGEEVYYANNKRFVVKQGEYMIGNDFTKSFVKIDQPDEVQGLCIDISPDIIAEVADYHDVSGSDLKEFLLSDQLFVNRYNAKNTCLGYSLSEINSRIKTGSFENNLQHSELFYSLAESIITDQRFVFDHLSKMNFKKAITNEEVFRSLLQAKELMDIHMHDNLSLDAITKHSGISKYHFIRLFKNTFGVSPYQYQQMKRLDSAKTLLGAGNSIFDVALMLGYADVPTFTKAFKHVFGVSPGNFRKSNF